MSVMDGIMSSAAAMRRHAIKLMEKFVGECTRAFKRLAKGREG